MIALRAADASHGARTEASPRTSTSTSSERRSPNGHGSRRSRTWLAGALAVLALADTHVRAQSPDALPKYPPVRLGEPSVGYQRSPAVTMVMHESADGTLFQSAWCDKHRRTVKVRARYFIGGNRRTRVEDVDEFDVRYWPTELSVVAENTLCIGGKSEDGHTVIERWTFAAPAHEVSSPNDGATPVHTVTTGAPLHVEVLYDDAVPRRDIVHVILPVLGSKSPELLIQFADSADLWKLDTSDKRLALVATPHPATATAAHVPLVPLLAQRMHARWCASIRRTATATSCCRAVAASTSSTIPTSRTTCPRSCCCATPTRTA